MKHFSPPRTPLINTIAGMMTLTLFRHTSTDSHTLGQLYDARGHLVCSTLELPWRDNRRNISCIPAGTYRVNYLPRSASGRYRDVYHVAKVRGRSGVLFHAGNTIAHTRGCILPASVLARHRHSNSIMGLRSRVALRRLHTATGRQNFNLKIEDLQQCSTSLS